MKAVCFTEHGGPEQLRYGELPDPELRPGEVLVGVRACALNHLDIWVLQGFPGVSVPMPHILGSDIAGEILAFSAGGAGRVEAGGAGASGTFSVGQKVLVFPGISCHRCSACSRGDESLCPSYQILGFQRQGGYADKVAVPQENLIPMPGSLSWEEAASVPLVFTTAWHMLVARAAVRPRETVLVMGAGSGVGSAALQVARLLGARVLATAGSEEKLAKAKQFGADAAFDYRDPNWVANVRSTTDQRGVDVVFEHIGGEILEQALGCLSRGGRLVSCGATAGRTVRLDLRAFFVEQQAILGSTMGSRAELLEVVSLIDRGLLRPVVDRIFPLGEARAAHETLHARKNFGKVVLRVG